MLIWRLRDATQSESPAVIKQLLEEAQDYGEELEKEAKPARDQMDKLNSSAADEMKKLVNSEEFADIISALEKYEGFDGAKDPGLHTSVGPEFGRCNQYVCMPMRAHV